MIRHPTVTPGELESRTARQSIYAIGDLPANVDGLDETLSFSALSGTTTAGGSFRIRRMETSFIRRPSDDFVGTTRVTFVVNDGSGSTSSGKITIEVIDLCQENIFIAGLSINCRGLTASSLVGTDALGNTH